MQELVCGAECGALFGQNIEIDKLISLNTSCGFEIRKNREILILISFISKDTNY